jgi:hypothetical protein
MGIFSDIGKGLGQLTGFGSAGRESITQGTTADPEAYKQLYEQALAELRGVDTNMSGADKGFQDQIRQAAMSQLSGLEDNAAGRKQNFMEDTSRGFSSDLASLARAQGGTGNMANAFGGKNLGQAFDAQARARSRGLLDLQGQALKDLQATQGIQGNLLSQNQTQQNLSANKANAIAQLNQGEANSRRGIMGNNASNTMNTNQAVAAARYNTVKDIATGVGSAYGAPKKPE